APDRIQAFQSLGRPRPLDRDPLPSNQAETWTNVWVYTTIPNVQEILVLKPASIGAELLLRNPNGPWPSQPLSLEAGDLTLESIGFNFPLAAAYRTTRFAAKNR